MLESIRENAWGMYVVAKREFIFNLKSARMFVLVIIFALTVLGGAYGLSELMIRGDLPDTPEYLHTPETVLIYTSLFIAWVGSLSAIVISFDSIVRERLENTIEILLSKPLSKDAIALGKFLGVLGAIVVPFSVIIAISIIIIGNVAGNFPSTFICIGFILFTIIFFAIYILIQQIFSTIARTTGTAIILGILTWFILVFFWLLIILSVAHVIGIEPDPLSDQFQKLYARSSLFNPGGSYQMSLGMLSEQEYKVKNIIPPWAPSASLCSWLITLLAIYLLLFRGRAE